MNECVIGKGMDKSVGGAQNLSGRCDEVLPCRESDPRYPTRRLANVAH
jgi:hypothetical protein